MLPPRVSPSARFSVAKSECRKSDKAYRRRSIYHSKYAINRQQPGEFGGGYSGTIFAEMWLLVCEERNVELDNCVCRYFISYSGVKLPLKPVNELPDESHLENRNTYFRGFFDTDQRLLLLEKLVYGDIELRHRYRYHPNGVLADAEITDADGEIAVLSFDQNGTAMEDQSA